MPLPLSVDALNNALDNLLTEHHAATKDLQKEWDEDLKFFRGQQWPGRLPKHRIPFCANLLNVNIKRKTALITDSKPSVEVYARAHGLEDLAQNLLTPTVRAIWDEQSFSEKLANGVLPMSMIFGSCPVNVCFDPTLNNGRGDVTMSVLDPRSFFVDPAITSAVDLEKAEFAGFRTVMSLDSIRETFPERGHLVEAQTSVSRFLDRNAAQATGVQSPVHSSLMAGSLGNRLATFAVERAVVEEFWVKDRRKVSDLPLPLQQQALAKGLQPGSRAWPGGRRIVRAGANKTILLDQANPYIDGSFPFEIMDWDVEIENPWGMSELKLIKNIQQIINKVGGQLSESSIKLSNSIWIADRDALEKHEWAGLTDAPGLIVKVKPGRMIKRESPPALPGSIFQFLQWLALTLDTITGINDATQGKRPVGLVSGAAIDSLQMASQTLVRLQARKMEKFLERVGSKVVNRVMQFYTSNRLLNLLGPNKELEQFYFEREKLLSARVEMENGESRPFDPFTDYKDFRFFVMQGSSMAVTRLQKGAMAGQLYAANLIPGVDVLKALEWPAAEETFKKAKTEALSGLTPQAGGGRGRSQKLAA